MTEALNFLSFNDVLFYMNGKRRKYNGGARAQ